MSLIMRLSVGGHILSVAARPSLRPDFLEIRAVLKIRWRYERA